MKEAGTYKKVGGGKTIKQKVGEQEKLGFPKEMEDFFKTKEPN